MSNVARMMAGLSSSITDFKANPNAIIEKSGGEVVAVLKSNEPCFYAVPPALFEYMAEAVEDMVLLMQANERINDGKERIKVNIDDL